MIRTKVKINITAFTIDPAEEERIIAAHKGDRDEARAETDAASERIDMSLFGDLCTEDGQTVLRNR